MCLKPVALQHPLELVGFSDAASEAQPEEPTGLALRGLVVTHRGDGNSNGKPAPICGEDLSAHFAVRRQRGVEISTFSVDLNGPVDCVE